MEPLDGDDSFRSCLPRHTNPGWGACDDVVMSFRDVRNGPGGRSFQEIDQTKIIDAVALSRSCTTCARI